MVVFDENWCFYDFFDDSRVIGSEGSVLTSEACQKCQNRQNLEIAENHEIDGITENGFREMES